MSINSNTGRLASAVVTGPDFPSLSLANCETPLAAMPPQAGNPKELQSMVATCPPPLSRGNGQSRLIGLFAQRLPEITRSSIHQAPAAVKGDFRPLIVSCPCEAMSYR